MTMPTIKLIEPTKGSNEGLAITVMGLKFAISTRAIEHVHGNGAVSYVESGDAFAHTLVAHEGKVMELVLGNDVSMRLAKLLKGQIKPKKKISTPVEIPPTTTPTPPTAQATPAKRRPFRWIASTLTGPQIVPVGSMVHRVPATAIVRFNGRAGRSALAYVLAENLVHVLGVRGEAVLEPGEAQRLASRWEHLVIGT